MEVGMGGLWIWGQIALHSSFQASLGYIVRAPLKKIKEKSKKNKKNKKSKEEKTKEKGKDKNHPLPYHPKIAA